MNPKEFVKKVRELRDLARKQADRRGDKWICELSFWGTAKNGLDEILREIRKQEKRID
jgi:hypothetical protein